MLNEMRVDLIDTAKTIVQQLKQDPTTATDYPFKGYHLRSIDRFAHAAKLQPQDAGNPVGSVEENKGAEQMHPLLTYTASYIELFGVVKQRTNRSLEQVKQILGEQAA